MPNWRRPTELPIDPFGTPDRGFATMRVTSPFGWRDNPLSPGSQVFHGGLDIGNARLGDKLVACADGRVEAVGFLKLPWSQPSTQWPSGNYGGLMVILDHGTHISLYAHMRVTAVTAGTQIKAGTLVGEVGETGSATGRGHLHFGISNHSAAEIKTAGRLLPNSWTVDPWPLISGTSTLPDAAMAQGDPMFDFVPQAWTAGTDTVSTTIAYDGVDGAPTGQKFAKGTLLTSIGEPNADWRVVLASPSAGARKGVYVKRSELTAVPPLPRDVAFGDAVWDLLLSRKAPAPVAEDCSQEVAAAVEPLQKRIEAAKAALGI